MPRDHAPFRRLAAGFVLALLLVCGGASAQAVPGDIDQSGAIDMPDRDALFSHLRRETLLTGDALARADANEDGEVDVADLVFIARQLSPLAAPLVDAPASPTSETEIVLTGTTEAGALVLVIGAAAEAEGTADGSGAFSIPVTLKPDQLNRLFVLARVDSGMESPPAPLMIFQDGQPPNLFIDFPEDGAILTTTAIDVAGRVGDMLSGAMGVGVTVNGAAGNVAIGIGTNGSFERGAVPLELGENTLTAVARDAVGNETARSITVTRIEPSGARMVTLVGNGQKAPVNSSLPLPATVSVTNEDGTPLASKLLTFEVTRSDGRLNMEPGKGADDGALMVQARTDENGTATVYWTLGSDAGCGNNRLRVTATDVAGSAFFCASAMPGPPVQINVGTGNNQKSEAGAPAPEPLRAWVNDACNPVEGVDVTFTVVQGSGLVNGAASTTVPTGPTGHAVVDFFTGPATGNNIIEADYPGNPGPPATFFVRGLERQGSDPTRFTGIVLTNGGAPIGGAHVVLDVAGESFETFTEADGRFVFTDIPGGPGHLHVDGLVATSANGEPVEPGSFPILGYEMVIVPNTENSLPLPVLLPSLNPANAKMFDNTEDIVLTVEEMEGLEMTVHAGSMRRGDGSVPSPDDPAILTLNQVHIDDVPMPMPDGAAPRFAWTLQPGGAIFDPPISVSYPNMTGLPGGAIAYFLNFNHSLGQFEIVASGSVTPDGLLIVTDPGSGLREAAWGGNCPPYAATGDLESGAEGEGEGEGEGEEGCETQCIDSGSLSGGEVRRFADEEVREVGSLLTWFVDPQVADTGGLQLEICTDEEGEVISETEIVVPGVLPSYSWTVVHEQAGEIGSGEGSIATAFAAAAGKYTCTFTAVADRECPPEGEFELAPVETYATGVELDIFRPKVIDTAESQIDSAVERSMGAQTFVNLDNDDRDGNFDLGTMDMDVADDELVKVRMRIRGVDVKEGTARLTVESGDANIKIWKMATKGMEYVPGADLAVPGDFMQVGNNWELDYWVEGIMAHTAAQGTVLKFEYDQLPDVSDEVAVTVLGIERVAWRGLGNSLTDTNALDADPNHPAGLMPDALRLFADARIAGGVLEANPRNTVHVDVMLSVKPVEPVKIYFDSFDVDDPTVDTMPIDDETGDEDNRGTDPAQTGMFTGEMGGILEKTFTNQMETLFFKTTIQPGDNFRVAGNGDKDFVMDMENRDSTLGAMNVDRLRIVNPHVMGMPPAKEIREIAKYASNVLTVWRFIHVEVDSMVAPPASGMAQANEVIRQMDEISTTAGVASHLSFTANIHAPQDTTGDGMGDVTDMSVGNGRFENASVFVGSDGIETAGILGNGADFVQHNPGFNVPFVIETSPLLDPAPAATSGSVIGWAGRTFTVDVAAGALSNLHVDGILKVAGISFLIESVTLPANQITVTALSLKTIPVRLVDDDNIVLPRDSRFTHMESSDDPAANYYARAYIRPRYDGGGSVANNKHTVPFILNTESALVYKWESRANNQNRFWVVYVLTAVQDSFMNMTTDGDPNSEGTVFGSAQPTGGCLIYVEPIREGGPTSTGMAVGLEDRTVAHEVGHNMRLDHGNDMNQPNVNGAMNTDPSIAPDAANARFIDRHLHEMRSLTKPRS